MITDDKRLELASHRRFNITYNFDQFPKTRKGHIDFDNTTKKNAWLKKQEEWHNKVQKGHHIKCQLCKKYTTNFNFIEIDDSFTTPNKLWCKECELWWNQRNGFKLTLEILLERKLAEQKLIDKNFQTAYALLDIS